MRLLKSTSFRAMFALALVTSTSLEAQQPLHSPREIAEIVDAAILGVLTPELSLTTFTVAQRGIRFDFERTMTAFGYAGKRGGPIGLSLRAQVSPGNSELLTDCDQAGSKSCARLAKSTYVYVEPMSVAGSDAVVWLHVTWATSLPTRSFLSQFSTQVHLSRSGSGTWKFVRAGLTSRS